MSTTSTGTCRPPRRAATSTSCSRRCTSSRWPSSRPWRVDRTAGRLVLDELRMSEDELREVDKVFVVACGTAYHPAGRQVRHRALDPAVGGDRDRQRVPLPRPGAGPQHPGHRHLPVGGDGRHPRGGPLRAAAAGPGADRLQHRGGVDPAESDAVLYTRAGPEVCVAATKTFATQLAAMYLVALYLAQVRGTMFTDEVASVVRELEQIPAKVELSPGARPTRSARWPSEYKDAHDWLFLGRHVGYPMALEGALKLKEISYLHAEGYPAAELKHGPIALVEDGTRWWSSTLQPRLRQDADQHPGGRGQGSGHHRHRRPTATARWPPTPPTCCGCRPPPSCWPRWSA